MPLTGSREGSYDENGSYEDEEYSEGQYENGGEEVVSNKLHELQRVAPGGDDAPSEAGVLSTDSEGEDEPAPRPRCVCMPHLMLKEAIVFFAAYGLVLFAQVSDVANLLGIRHFGNHLMHCNLYVTVPGGPGHDPGERLRAGKLLRNEFQHRRE
jgi:hypothetical protein